MQEYAPRRPNDVEMINSSALVLLKKGDARSALKAAARSTSLKWGDPQPWEISGEAWQQLGHWEKAARCWEEALRLNPSNPRAHLALVELYDRMKDGPALRRMVARCLTLKGEQSPEEWLDSLAGNNGVSAYEVNPGMLSRIIRREISRELTRRR
jgi:tetratricopeptide (TPR) repeat protein